MWGWWGRGWAGKPNDCNTGWQIAQFGKVPFMLDYTALYGAEGCGGRDLSLKCRSNRAPKKPCNRYFVSAMICPTVVNAS